MKTFTTCAAKAKQFLNLLQGYTKGIRITAILILLLMGVNNAWAASEGSSWYDWASSENVYFDNTNSSYTNVSMLIGRQWTYGGDGIGSSGVNFTKVANTNNLYHAATTWNHYNTLLFMDETGWGWEGNKVTQRYTYAKNYTNTNNININGTELFYAASSTKGATLNHQDLSGYAALNSQQTIQSVVDGTVANSKATISITSYKMTAHKTTTEQTATLGTGTDVSYITAARTATTTLTVGTVATGYQFDGWYAAETGGTALSTSTTYTYYPTAATTVYARFSTKQHTVKFDVHSSGHGSITAKVGSNSITSGNKVNYGSEVVFTAKPDDGYQIEGWYSNSACTTPIDNGTNKTYTVTIKGGTNVYVKFVEIPVNSHNITYTAQGTGWTYGLQPTSAEEREKVRFEVFPTTGYKVTVKSDGPELVPNGNEYSFEMPGKDVAITVIAEEILSTITIVAKPEKGGTLTVDGVAFASGNTVQVGVSTAKKVTANPNPGYGVNAWAVSSREIVKASGGTTVTLTADGSGREGTLYANFGILTYNITYNLDGGTNHANNPADYTVETPTITLKDPTKKGYTFKGWYSDANFTNKVTEITTGSTEDKALYAKWEEIKSTITVTTANVEYGTLKFNSTAKTWGTTASVGIGTSQSITATANKGYKFVEWKLSGSATSTSTLTNATIALKADGSGSNGTATAVFEVIPLDTIYFVNDKGWTSVKVHLWGGDEDDTTWPGIEATKADFRLHCCDVYYVSALPGSYKNCIFNNGSGSQTADLTWTADKYFYDNAWKTLAELTYDVKLAGTMYNNWDGVAMTVDDNNTNSITVSLNANQTYEFKIVVDDNWHGNNGTMTYDNCTGWKMSTNTDNCKITTLIAGDYTFTYDVCTAELSVTYPIVDTYDVTIDADPAEAAATLTSSPQAVGILPVEISTTANAGYKFKEWTATTGITITKATSSTTTITATQAGTVTAHFIPVQPTTVYFKPIDDWKGDKIRFAVYYWDEYSNDGWVNMEDVGCTGEYFKAVVPGGYPNINFVSFPTDKENDRANRSNQTEDLTVPTDENVLFDMGTTSANKLYLKPNDKWENEGNERYAAYFFENGEKWVDMRTSSTLSGYYECDKQSGFAKVIFVRMDGANATNNWSSKWTQTNDLTIPTNGDNIFTIADNAVTSQDQNADGYWSAGDNSQWTTFTEPTYSITLKANPHGTYTIAYAGETATSKTTEDVVIDKLPINTTITFTENAPQDGWALKDMSITANGETDDEVALNEAYVMCSDVTITPQFVSAVPQVVYLKTSAWNSDSPKWVAHAFNNSDSEDVDLTAINTCTDQPEFYQCTIPAGYHSLVFYRKKGDGSEIWNQTADLTLPVKSDKNYYTFDNGGDNSKWSTNNHTYDVQVTASGGTITIIYDGTPIAVTNASEIITLPVNAVIKVDFSGAVLGYIPNAPSIKIGNQPVETQAGEYTICGPTTISTGFVTERPHTVYLAPTYRWNADHAKFAVYAFDNNGKGQWIEMQTVAAGSCDNTYFVCEIPAGMTAFSFVRLKPDGGLDWDSKWNQTNDLTIPVDGNNCYTITAMGESKSAGKWGVYVEQTSFQVTLLPTLDGTITVEYNGTTTTSSPGQDVVLNVEKDATIVLTFTPNENYKLASTSIIIGTNNEETAIAGQAYTICGATTIAAHFISTLNLQTIYLRPNEDWLKDDPIFAAYFYDSNNTDTYEWVELKTEKTDYTGSYSCQVSQHFDHVVFVRINPEGDQPFNNGINWKNAWNQTKSLQITSNVLDQYGYRFAIGEKITQEGEDKNRYDGHWEQNTPIWSIRGQFNNWNGDAAVLRGYEGKAKLKLNANSEYHFKLYNYFGGNDDWQKWYGLSMNAQAVTIDRTNYDTWRGMSTYNGSANNILKTDYEGVYVFKLQYKTTGSDNNKTLNKNLKVVFPTSAYRLAYMEEGKPETFRLSRYIEYIDEDSQIDTVSFFVDITKSPYIYILQGLDITKLDTIAMHHIAEGIDGDGENPGEAMLPNRRNAGGELHIGSGCGVKENYVYNFMLQQTNEPAQEPVHEATLLAKETHKYEGDYYIRTDGAEGGWNNYLQEGNKMTYFVYRPQQGEKYNHYWVASVRHSDDNNKVNVKARIANLYSDHLAIELAEDKSTDEYGDVYIKDPNGKIEKVNLRFGYNPSTNFFERAMLTGSGNNNQFLNITSGNTTIFLDSLQQKRLDYADKQSKFTDISNWVYEKDVWIPVATTADSITVKLSAKQYNDTTTHLFGYKEDGVTPAERVIIGTGTTPNSYKMRVIYDFKVNRIIMAWIPGTQNLTEDINLNANILFIRHENDVVPQLNTNGQNIIGIQHQYFSMEFESKGKEDNHEEHYWFSLPFDCVVGSITGVHGYMDIWGIQRYNGKKRAEIGWFAETATFWEWLTPNDTLRAGEGYVLSFAKELATWNNYDVFDDNENYLKTLSILRLYFPAIETGFDFQTKDSLVVTYPNEPCTIELDERYKQDGNWKIIGSTSYNNVCAAADIKTHEDSVWHPEGYEWSAPKFRYSYTYDNSSTHNRKTKCKYVPENGKDASYNSFYGYMVQFAGTIKWEGFTQTIPRSVAARKNSSAENTTYTTCLELVDNTGYEHDRTFVALDEEATIYNDLNKDLCKVFNSYCAQLYTTADDVNYAGNTLPMEKVTVPVGVVVKEVGEYTFRMPDGTDGISAILVDNQTGAHTNMLLDEYTIILEAGTYENRFSLVLDPQRTSTEVENIGDGYSDGVNGNGTEGIKKYIIDGQLFIRTANGLFDAKGQRL